MQDKFSLWKRVEPVTNFRHYMAISLPHQTFRGYAITVGLSFLAALTILFLLLFLKADLIIGSQHVEVDSHLLQHSGTLPTVCTEESCRLEYVSKLHVEGVYQIPAIRHILWKSDSVSEYLGEQLRTWYQIHPKWTFVLWRDRDLEPFVSKHFPGSLPKYKSLPKEIMRVDFVRYLILYKYGGVYADLDYTLVRSLDKYRQFHAVITREPEAHSLEFLGMTWPPKLMPSPAFMMAKPGHTFFHFAMLAIAARDTKTVIDFAGPIGLGETIQKYRETFPKARSAMETVYVPPSYSFYPYPENRMRNSKSANLDLRLQRLNNFCKLLSESIEEKWRDAGQHHQLTEYCKDVNNMDPITNKSQPIIAIHDLVKPGPIFDKIGMKFYLDNPRKMNSILPGLKLGCDLG